MKKDIFYCEQWSYGYKKLHKPFSEKQAEEKHLKGDVIYCRNRFGDTT